MVVLNNEILRQIDGLGKADQTSMVGDLVINYVGSKNPHENITLALRSIKEDLKEILSQYPESFYFGQIHFNLLYEVIRELGWEIDFDNIEFNGWQYDVFVPIEVPYKDFYYNLDCSWYNSSSCLEKVYKNETKSCNC